MSRDQTEESKLAQAACDGDPKAFSLIVARYQKPVYNLCYRYLPGPDAEDLAQDTFVKAFVHRTRFDPDRALLPWLFTIARRLCIDRLRRKQPDLLSDDSQVIDAEPGADQKMSVKQELNALARALEKLPEGSREAINLCYIDGLSYQEAAEVLDVPIGTIMTWLHRGRAKLRKLMNGYAGSA